MDMKLHFVAFCYISRTDVETNFCKLIVEHVLVQNFLCRKSSFRISNIFPRRINFLWKWDCNFFVLWTRGICPSYLLFHFFNIKPPKKHFILKYACTIPFSVTKMVPCILSNCSPRTQFFVNPYIKILIIKCVSRFFILEMRLDFVISWLVIFLDANNYKPKNQKCWLWECIRGTFSLLIFIELQEKSCSSNTISCKSNFNMNVS